MVRVQGSITLNSTGLKQFNLGIAPTWAEFYVGERINGDNASHTSVGSASSSHQFCISTFADSIGADTFSSSAHVVRQYERTSTGIKKVLSAKLDSLTSTGIRLNVETANPNYQVFIIAGN